MEKLIIGLIVGLVIGAVVMYLYMPKAAKKKIDNFLTGLMSSNETIGEFLSRILTKPEANRFVNELKKKLSAEIYLRISDRSVSDAAAQLVVTHVSTRLTPSEEEKESQQGFFGRGKDMLKNLVKGHVEDIIQNNKDFIENTLSNNINNVIIRNGEDIVAILLTRRLTIFFPSQFHPCSKETRTQ